MPVAETADAAMRSAMRVGDLADLDFSATFEGQKKGSPSPYEVPATAPAPASLQLRPGAFLTLRVISTTHQVPVTALVGLAAVAALGVIVAIRGH